MFRWFVLLGLASVMLGLPPSIARGAAPEQPAKVGKLPHIEFDKQKQQVRVECEMLAVDAPLEFFCCRKNSNDYESMVRSEVTPSDLHFALLAIGCNAGEPVKYSQSLNKWFPPTGQPLQITMEYQKEGKMISEPAWKWMRDVKTHKPAPPFTWVFVGSRVMPDGKYAADVTGYLVSIVNFELTVIDIPKIASSSNELLEWERNPNATPKAGTKVWMVIEPAGKKADQKEAPASPSQNEKSQQSEGNPSDGQSALAAHEQHPATQSTGIDPQIRAADAKVKELKSKWEKEVAPQRDALRKAAEAHYQVLADLRRQQQALIDEADRIQRTIDELEKEYQDLTTPRPESTQ